MNPLATSIELARIDRQTRLDDAARRRRLPRRNRGEQRARRSR
jgi:hypothetical protein